MNGNGAHVSIKLTTRAYCQIKCKLEPEYSVPAQWPCPEGRALVSSKAQFRSKFQAPLCLLNPASLT